MKRLVSVLIAVFFMTGMAMAQGNHSETTQEGTGNDATVEQLGAEHESYIIQDSKTNKHNTAAFGNEANVKQFNGDDNYSLIYQNEGNGSKDAYADVEQKGSENESEIYQGYGYYNDMRLLQDGSGNWSYMKQNGSGNVATVDQLGDDNQSDVFQRGGAFLDVDQDGYGNDVDAHQDYSYQEGDIDQIGDRNIVNLTQKSRPDPSLGNHAEVYQEGDKNETVITQDGDNNTAKHWVYGYDNYMEFTQEGSENIAVVDQKTWKDVDNYGNQVSVYQKNSSNGAGNDFYAKLKGDENIINVTQNGSWNAIRGLNASYWNYGSMSEAFKYEGDNSTIDISQHGNQNRVFADIHNSNGDIDIDQDKNVNQAVIDIQGHAGGLLSGNKVDINQFSTGSDFTMSNFVDVTQRTNNNAAIVNQNGFTNNATIIQK
jgi:hypothetical protein